MNLFRGWLRLPSPPRPAPHVRPPRDAPGREKLFWAASRNFGTYPDWGFYAGRQAGKATSQVDPDFRAHIEELYEELVDR